MSLYLLVLVCQEARVRGPIHFSGVAQKPSIPLYYHANTLEFRKILTTTTSKLPLTLVDVLANRQRGSDLTLSFPTLWLSGLQRHAHATCGGTARGTAAARRANPAGGGRPPT
jgi:hypothetical protein